MARLGLLIGQNHFCRSAWPMMPTPVGAGYSSSWLAKTTRRMNGLRRWPLVLRSALASSWSVLCSWSTSRMNGLRTWPPRRGRVKHSSWSTSFLRAEAIYNLQPPVLPPPRPCRPSWATCVTLLDHLGILVGLSSSRPPAPLPCIQALAVLARTAQLPVRREHLVVAALAGPFWDLECSVEFAVPVGVWSAVLVDQVLVPFGESGRRRWMVGRLPHQLCRWLVSSSAAEWLNYRRRHSWARCRAAVVFPALSLLEGVCRPFGRRLFTRTRN